MVELYSQGIATTKIAVEFGCSQQRVSKIFARRGVTTRDGRRFDEATREEIVRRYAAGESTSAIGEALGVKHPTVANALRQEGVQLRDRVQMARARTGEKHPLFGKHLSAETIAKLKASLPRRNGTESPSWKGGRYANDEGYVFVYAPEHPCANSNGYIRDHRLVMEGHLGRYLRPEEVVHHINEIRDDNRIENLHLCADKWEHARIHGKDRTGSFAPKNCPACGAPMSRKQFPNGAMESPANYARRKSCGVACSRASRRVAA